MKSKTKQSISVIQPSSILAVYYLILLVGYEKRENNSTKISEVLSLTRQKLTIQGNAMFMQKAYEVVLNV